MTNGELHEAEVTVMRLFDVYTIRLWTIQDDKSTHFRTLLLALIVAALILVLFHEPTCSYGFRATATTISAVIATPFRHS